MNRNPSMRDEHKRVIGVLHAMVLDLKYQQETLHNLKLSLPEEITEQDRVMEAFFGARVHLRTAHRSANRLLDQVRLAQLDRLRTFRENTRKVSKK